MTAARRLAAILAADVVGYSRLMGQDEAGTAKAVREGHEASTSIVTGHGGRIVKTTGDGLLMEFPSVVAAVECAIAIQKLMTERNTETPEDKRILYRIGINLGDVLVEGDDIVGDGVNIAARLEGVCEPGAFMFQAPPMTMFAACRRHLRRSRREGPQEHGSVGAGLRDNTRLGKRGSCAAGRRAERAGPSAPFPCGPALRQHERRPGTRVFR
jgi:class 3 adenylate cyclase